MIPLYHSDLFVKENVGTDEQISDLKKQILDARDDNIGGTNATYDNVEWLYSVK